MRIDLAKDFALLFLFIFPCLHSSTVVVLRAKSIERRLEYVLILRRSICISLLSFPFIILIFRHVILFRYSRTFVYRELHPHFCFHINGIGLLNRFLNLLLGPVRGISRTYLHLISENNSI